MTTVLVADDDPQILRLVSTVLEGAGYDVLTTTEPREVLHLAAGGVDAIVLDVLMPQASGFQVLNELRANPATAELAILFLSGLADGSDRVRGLQHGADDYLVKPFEPQELVLRLERLIGARRPLEAGGAPPTPLDDPAGLAFGRYAVREVIGEGAMGTVYRGWDPRLEREVALKTVRLAPTAGAAQRRDLLERLRLEAITVARCNHPNVVAVYDMGDAGGVAFLAMEMIDGSTFADYLHERGPLPYARLVPFAAQVAAGLAAAHARGVIHRDVKPSNVLLGRDGAIKVTDFGLAYVVSSMSQEALQLYGTPGYVPPEVLHDEPYTSAGDLFGLGATLYEGLTGVQPLQGRSLKDTILNTMEGKIVPLREVCRDLPEPLAELVTSLLAVDPASRPDAAGVQASLEELALADGLRWTADDLPSPPAD